MPPISQELGQVVENELRGNRKLSLRAQMRLHEDEENFSINRLWQFRHQGHYHYYKRVPVCPLTADHMRARVAFCDTAAEFDPQQVIIFTDESTVEQDLNEGGIWRRKGERVEEGFFQQTGHPVHVMIWGGIGPNGYRTKLLQCPSSVNGSAYIRLLADNAIIRDLDIRFGRHQYKFQQDNAPAHGAFANVLKEYVDLVKWPARSADLSPIEQVWGYIKNRLKGRRFANEAALFQALCDEWYGIPNATLSNYYTAFRPRCIVCARHGGESLNGRWAEVHHEHHPAEE
jgi:hypothetical protein